MRIKLLLILLLTAWGTSAQSLYPGTGAGRVKVQCQPSGAECFDLARVRLLPGRVRQNLERDSAWMVSIEVGRLLHSFRNNAGVYSGYEGGYRTVAKLGGWESLDCDLRGHTTGHLLSAYALMHQATGAEIFRLKGDSLVSGLAQVQQALGASGYLSAWPEELINRNLRGQGVWAPWYTLHKLFAGLIDQYVVDGNNQALDVVTKMGIWAYNKLHDQPEQTRRLMLRNEFGGMNDAFYCLYAITADPRFLEMARYFYHNEVIDPLARGDFDFAAKHTNTFIPKIIGEVRNATLTGSETSKEIAEGFFRAMSLESGHTFATGSCSQKEHYFDPAHQSDFINGYTGESCCTYNMLKLAKHIFCLSPSAAVADYYERCLFNHILGQQDPASGMVCYFMPLQSGAYKVYSTPEESFWCCVGSGFESHAKYAEGVYFHSADHKRLFVSLFIPTVLDWQEAGLQLSQTTDFPYGSKVSLRVDRGQSRRTLSLRLPSWSGTPVVKVNGRTIKAKAGGDGFIDIDRLWRKGDCVEAYFPMSLHLEPTHDRADRAALLYGPIVLAADMGTQGMEGCAPFSDPSKHNDYYTYDYHIPPSVTDTLRLGQSLQATVTPLGRPMQFATADSLTLRPLFDMHHTRYTVYWNLK